MQTEGLDGLLGASFEDVYYLSNLWSENFFVLPKQTQVYALVAGSDLATPHVIGGLGEAASIFQACPPTVRPYLYGRFFRAVSQTTALTELEGFVKEHVVDAKPYPTLVDATVAAIEAAGLQHGTIAYDERGMFPQNATELQRRLSNARLVPGWDTFRRIRAVKTDKEVNRLKRVL